MSANNKVIWSEGLFLQPQHFQQQERYLERYVEGRCQALVPYSWGFTDVEIERDLLAVGRFGLRRAAGIFPDGTPFRMPDDEPLPPPLEIGEQAKNQVISLALPLRRGDAVQVATTTDGDELARHGFGEWDARNNAANVGDPATLQVGPLRTRLLLSSAPSHAYSCVPMAHLVECRTDGQVVLDDTFIPTVLVVRAAPRLRSYLGELRGKLRLKGDSLRGRVVATSRGGQAEFNEYLTLQVINRLEAVISHHASTELLHPEALFRLLIAAAGELSTFTTHEKRCPVLPPYKHDRLRESFEPVAIALEKMLNYVGESSVVDIPIEAKRFNMHVAIVAEKELFDTAMFVLATHADLPSEDMRRRFPAQFRIGTVERIRDMVRLQLPGVPLHPMPAPPPQLPFYAGQVYFELDQSHEMWSQLRASGSLALHVNGEFPGLALKLWAIRR
jgi:type VI secretion system protein ImpJ